MWEEEGVAQMHFPVIDTHDIILLQPIPPLFHIWLFAVTVLFNTSTIFIGSVSLSIISYVDITAR